MTQPAIAIHGGCGVMAKLGLTDAEWASARADLATALRAGWKVLTAGGPALDAVEAAIIVLEDSPNFNAGHGAALNAAGEHELDASIMRGADRAAGAVTLTRRIRNPIRAARAVLEASGEALQNARLQLGYAEGRYQAGVGDVIELENAQLAVTNAEYQRVTAEYNLAIARAQLVNALGRRN